MDRLFLTAAVRQKGRFDQSAGDLQRPDPATGEGDLRPAAGGVLSRLERGAGLFKLFPERAELTAGLLQFFVGVVHTVPP